MERPLRLQLGDTVIHENGTKIHARPSQVQRRAVSEVAYHEAAHVVVAGQIHSATIIPGSNYQGATRPLVMTAESAMAAHALGFGGTGWDRFLTKHLLHADPDAAASSAAATLSTKQEEMEEVALSLEEFGTIGQDEVNKAYKKAGDRRSGVFQANVTVEKPDGTSAHHVLTSHHLTVMVPGEFITLPTAKGKSNS